MSVYVDGMQRYDHAPKVRGRAVAWCHMKWKHDDHFDLTSKQRERAIALGARPVTSRDLVALRRKARGAHE